MKRALKWAAIGMAGLISVALIAVIVLSVLGGRRLNARYEIPAEGPEVSADPASIERGRHLATALTLCNGCHGDDLSGTLLEEVPGVMTLAAPNLTSGRGGSGGLYSDADRVRAIRHGVNRDGRGLLIMHADAYNNLSRSDLAAIVAYVKSVPPVDNELATEVRFLGRAMVALGLFDTDGVPLIAAEQIDHSAPFREAPDPGPTAEYGEYLMSVSVCAMCHGEDLRGRPPLDPASPPGPDIARRAGDGGWSDDQFMATIRTGVTPDGRSLNPEWMPWSVYARLSNDELLAIWRRMQVVARETGG
ncbi:MAG TPA: c-type cytochrome [Gemmatimonadaceae bacterium]